MDSDPMRTGPTLEGLKRAYPDVADRVLSQLPDLYARCAAHFGPALDVGAVLKRYTQANRIRFTSGGSTSGRFGCDELDAMIHAAEHGYELCLRQAAADRYCWLPWGHEGECVADSFSMWRLLFGQPASGVALMDPQEAATALSSERQYRLPGLGERPQPPAPAAYRVVLCMERHEACVLEKPDGLRVEVIPWGRLAEDPDTDPGAMDLLNEALDEGDLDRALEPGQRTYRRAR